MAISTEKQWSKIVQTWRWFASTQQVQQCTWSVSSWAKAAKAATLLEPLALRPWAMRPEQPMVQRKEILTHSETPALAPLAPLVFACACIWCGTGIAALRSYASRLWRKQELHDIPRATPGLYHLKRVGQINAMLWLWHVKARVLRQRTTEHPWFLSYDQWVGQLNEQRVGQDFVGQGLRNLAAANRRVVWICHPFNWTSGNAQNGGIKPHLNWNLSNGRGKPNKT